MADYYPLIARAVAGLDRNSGDARRTVYERARAALVAQLRGVTPALNESDVTRERLALEEAIRKVEAESARQPAKSSEAAKGKTPDPPRWDEPEEEPEPPPPPPRRTASMPRQDGRGMNAASARRSTEPRYDDVDQDPDPQEQPPRRSQPAPRPGEGRPNGRQPPG